MRRASATLTLLSVIACGTPQTPAPSAAPAPQTTTPALAATTTAPQQINDDPARLVGLDAAELTALLGEPVRVRRDDSAEIRQFRNGNDCQIDTFLYPDGTIRRVSHVEIRSGIDRLPPDNARACLRRLIVARPATRPTS